MFYHILLEQTEHISFQVSIANAMSTNLTYQEKKNMRSSIKYNVMYKGTKLKSRSSKDGLQFP